MSWVITGTYKGAAVSDADAQAYLRAVEQADNQGPLEQGVQQAVNQFVIGCKADGIWGAIKASCILAGARTLTGALVPLVGTAPTSFNFVSGDYNRKTGLVGDGSTKYLNSNRLASNDPQDSFHQAVWRTVSETRTENRCLMGNVNNSRDQLLATATQRFFRNRVVNNVSLSDASMSPGLLGHTRSTSTTVIGRYAGINTTFTGVTSLEGSADNHLLYRRSGDYADARLSFYSIGESLDLALLDARVTTLINAFDAAI